MARIPIWVRAIFFWLLFAAMISYSWATQGGRYAAIVGLSAMTFGAVGLIVLLVAGKRARAASK